MKMFKSMYNGLSVEEMESFGSSYKSEKVPVYQFLPPLAKNEKGEIINLSLNEKRVQVGSYDSDEKIESFRDSQELYSILKRFANSQDTSWLNVSNGVYADISDMPDNFVDLDNLRRGVFAKIDKLKKEDIEKYNQIFNFNDLKVKFQNDDLKNDNIEIKKEEVVNNA